MNEFINLLRRNIRLFFKDRGMLMTSLITPLILLVLYGAFLFKVYRDTFLSNLPEGFDVSDSLINGCVGGQLVSSILAVCCVTVAFCANLIMVQDKVTGARNDIIISPVKSSTVALSYYLSTAVNTALICLIAALAGFVCLSFVGWFLTLTDVLLIIVDVLVLVMFGTALSSIVCCKLSTEGQKSAVGTIISAGYGFLCGAYMPISQFGAGLQKVLSFFPGTYGTSLLRDHVMRGSFAEMERQNVPTQVINSLKDAMDCNFYFFETQVNNGVKYIVLVCSVAVLIALFVLLNISKPQKSK